MLPMLPMLPTPADSTDDRLVRRRLFLMVVALPLLFAALAALASLLAVFMLQQCFHVRTRLFPRASEDEASSFSSSSSCKWKGTLLNESASPFDLWDSCNVSSHPNGHDEVTTIDRLIFQSIGACRLVIQGSASMVVAEAAVDNE